MPVILAFRRKGDRRIPEAYWLLSLAETMRSRFNKTPWLKESYRAMEEETNGELQSLYTFAYRLCCTHMQT